MFPRATAAAVTLCIVSGLFGGAAQAQDQFDRYGFDRPAYNVYVDTPGPTAGVFVRYRPNTRRSELRRGDTDYGVALTFANGPANTRRTSMELRFNGGRPEELWINGAREMHVMSFNANADGQGPATATLMSVGALLVGLAAVASNEAENPCTGGYLTATGCVSNTTSR